VVNFEQHLAPLLGTLALLTVMMSRLHGPWRV